MHCTSSRVSGLASDCLRLLENRHSQRLVLRSLTIKHAACSLADHGSLFHLVSDDAKQHEDAPEQERHRRDLTNEYDLAH